MAGQETDRVAIDRVILLTLGAMTGLAAYVLVDVLPDRVENERLLLLIAAATGGFFACFLAATGPLPFSRAGVAAALTALPAAGLLFWASFRFAEVKDFIETGHPSVAFVVIVGVLLPFLIAAQRAGEGWRHYPALFNQSWNIVVRYSAALVFTGVFWGVVFLSDALFGLVGLDIIEELLDIDWVPFVLTGAVLGLAMAVVVELSDYVSPFLILRLLRLLMPLVLVVTAVFLGALPLQGLSDLFGGLSAAAVLMAMALGIATLITSALDCTDADAVDAKVMLVSAQLLALAMPVLAALAVYAIWLRVDEYGWTPDRLAAISAAAVTMGYGVLYSLAVVLRGGWMARIRGANIAMALAAVLVSVIWLSPVLNPQAISARDQVARFARGDVSAEQLDLWFIGRELGVAGETALAELSAMDHPEAEVLGERLARLETAGSRYIFLNRTVEFDGPVLIADLLEKLIVLPEGKELEAAAFDGLAPHQLRDLVDACNGTTPGGNRGCVAVIGDFIEGQEGEEGLLFYATGETRALLRALQPERGGPPVADPVLLQGFARSDVTPETIDALISGDFQLAPRQILTLGVGDVEIMLKP